MEYQTTKQIAQKWGISDRRVRILCSQGKIMGAKRMGWAWMIPEAAEKPLDGRVLRRKQTSECSY